MKKGACFFAVTFLFLLSAASSLFAFGRKDAAVDSEPVNAGWTLCVTAIDVSALPVARHIAGDTIVKSLASSLRSVDFRVRGEEEAAYYRDVAWAKARAEAARSLQAKRNERDLLIYRGDSGWKYRKNLLAVDDAITKLEDNMAEIDGRAPVVEGKPKFRLTEGNGNGIFPGAPRAGGEYRFCTEQKVDAFVTGRLSEYHDRLFLSIRVYTLFTRSYSYEDFVLFSSEDLSGAMDEISVRLSAAVSGTLPSAILIAATPKDAMVSIDDSFVGRGNMEMYAHSPGEAEITIRSDNYVPASFTLELREGELAELYIDLTPLGSLALDASVPGNPGSRVFLGSLFVGETPLTLQLPKNQYSYISVEAPSGETGAIVYRDNDLIRGRAQFIRADPAGDDPGTAAFSTRVPVSPEEKRVDRARRGFYGAYGAFWVILPAALITGGIAKTHSVEFYTEADFRASKWGRIRTASNIAWGTSLGFSFFQIFRFLYISRADSTPIVKVQNASGAGP